jgi:spermidine synthase
MKENQRYKSFILKFALFATGLSGIVAEYILSTLASYFLGDSILQWTLVLSLMLFSMGLGSRISRWFVGNLLEKFIIIEFILSALVGFSAMIVYVFSAFTLYYAGFIYGLSMCIGFLIGLEIPLVTRLNKEYEPLRVNIASVMEHDYFGSLVGGIFFAFVGLPYLGLTYTPFVLGIVNFSVAFVLFLRFKSLVTPSYQMGLNILCVFVFGLLVAGIVFAEPIIFFGEQRRYKDKIVFEKQSKYQKIVITQWKNEYWLYINGHQQLSTIDEVMYHEPLVHPIMKLAQHPQDVLVMGGGDGAAVRDILKHPSVKNITVIDLDPVMIDLAKTHPVMLAINDSSFYNSKVKIYNQDAYKYMADTKKFYDVIIIDLTDPKSVELGRLYSKEFYTLCYKHLRPQGFIITQAGSPYYATKAFECINITMAAAGFSVAPLHNQVLTLGEWGWALGAKHLTPKELKNALQKIDFKDIKTSWINKESMLLLTSFGKKDFFLPASSNKVEVNTIHHPVLYKYYLNGNWDLY